MAPQNTSSIQDATADCSHLANNESMTHIISIIELKLIMFLHLVYGTVRLKQSATRDTKFGLLADVLTNN